jgi:tRNA(Glu) U13 pseudouridine synthase TruD
MPVLKPVKNLYGEQRFGTNNAEIGFTLLRKEYKKAVEMLGLPQTADPIGVLRKMPKHTLILYIHAAQSQLWNDLAVTLPPVVQDVPMPGYGVDNSAYEELFTKYNISEDNLVNRSMSELSLEGSTRPLLQDIQDFAVEKASASSWKISFSLGTGSYATQTLRALLEEE